MFEPGQRKQFRIALVTCLLADRLTKERASLRRAEGIASPFGWLLSVSAEALYLLSLRWFGIRPLLLRRPHCQLMCRIVWLPQ